MIVAPLLCSARIRSRSNRMFTGSRPLNGSSRINRSGACRTAAMSCTFCSMPFDSSSHFLSCTPGKIQPLEPCRRARRREVAHAFQPRHVGEERSHLHLSVDAALFREIADTIFRFDRRRPPQHRQLAAIRKQDRHDHAERRRLAGAVGPDEPVERSHRHLEIEIVDGDRRAEGLRHAAQRDGGIHAV